MPISSFDFISPKITLKYNGRNSHISRIGGFLSLCLSIIICISVFYYFWGLIEPRYYSSLLYEENVGDNKLSQNINFSGINHFLQIYSHTSGGWFGDIDNKNIIIYAVKENNNIYRNNNFSEKLSDIEHWLYDKCDKINNININLFDEISNYVKNYTSSICIRFYFNPRDQKYYEIGNDGYVEPYLETSKFNEKQYAFKIIIEKCLNNSFINNNIGYICNSEININKYFDIYDEIVMYFTYNQIMPLNKNNQFKKNFYSISSKLNTQFSYFVNNIIFLPIKIKRQNSFNHIQKDNFSFSLFNHFEYQKSYDNESYNLVGIYNLYLNRNILSYQIRFSNIIDILSHLGGLIKIFFLFFKILNYVNHHYIVFENTKELFNISTGIETSIPDSKDISFDNIRHVTTKNFKISQFNTNTNEDLSRRLIRNFSPVHNNNKKKYKYFEGITPKAKQSSKKNVALFPINTSSNKKNNLAKKNTNTFHIKNKDKRKSYLSQGYRVKSKDNKDNTIYIRNKSYNEKDEYNNEQQSSKERNKNINTENNSIVLIPSKKSNNEFNPIKNKKSKKNTNLKMPNNKNPHEKTDNSHLNLKNYNKMRHKSINYTNQKKFFRNSIFNKNHFMVKNSSELINDSSKQNLFNNKSILLNINRTQYDKGNENNVRVAVINNNTDVVNSTKNIRTIGNNNNNINGNGEVSLFIKSLMKNKLKMEMSEGKEGFANIIAKKIKGHEFLKSLFICCKRNENKAELIYNFRNNLLSEQHLYRNHINLYLIQKLFQMEEAFKLDFKELYINL